MMIDRVIAENMRTGYYAGTKHIEGTYFFIKVFKTRVRITFIGGSCEDWMPKKWSESYPKSDKDEHALKPITKDEAVLGLL